MPDENAEMQNDGSLISAALNMPDIDDGLADPSPAQTTTIVTPQMANQHRKPRLDDNVVPIQNRGKDGKFAEGFAEQPGQNEPTDPSVTEQGDEVSTTGTDEEWFELPPEKEGEEPRRIKADEVWQGFQEREQLKAQIEEMQRIQPPPPEYDQHIYQTVQARTALLRELDTLMQANQPIDPDLDLINSQSPRYDPDAYQRQVAFQREQIQRLQAIRTRKAQEESILSQEQEALVHAKKAREQGKLLGFWPELKDPVLQRQVRDDAARYYGVDDAVFTSVLDARFYAVLRDALAYRNGQKQRQATVKVVRSKPKLVKGQARSSTSPKQAQYTTGMRALERSGSIEDAANALGGLI